MPIAPSHVLVTGFEPFDNDPVNPSWEVARALEGWDCGGATVRAVQLPCVFGQAAARLDAALAQWRPRLVVGLGLAGGRTEWQPERVAINCDDARIPDNAGRQPVDTAVVPGGPAAYFSTLPIKAIVRELRAAGLPASVSNTAGTFVCNHVFYALMHRLAGLPGVRGGFVHVPALPEQAARHPGLPSMALAAQVEALRVTLRTALAVQTDIVAAGGQLH
ncbi:pyroglutamyl-peptidase I [Pseudorhodoferax sp. Leaf265]|uniref:pyroglutamyl-peptidase I n=1 Tax=Pseudorhodoferax sp. Leaf265 TaxID=1736315 RepID=UPI000AC2211F|nr:pyroglutamyl-peptidase I [Pseudorhodoferax sp. Leaf265]PZP97483.1 MAG: pyroglutamyl-peptidase I [Variovorax paradoxus]PZQ08920.1 MAG: pyroglutamyl-peptidase I [Variovorax paradoxus]